MLQVSSLDFGQVGFQQFSTPVLTFGTTEPGQPKVGITCCIHGDETSGLYIVARVIKELELRNSRAGTVYILPAANPVAILNNKRVSVLDYKDLNRVGKGNKDGSFTERTGAVLFEFLSQLDLVIDIHSFPIRTPITAIFLNTGNTQVKKKTLSAIHAFSPEIIWAMNTPDSQDAVYSTVLGIALANAGIACLPIETTQLAFLPEAEIEKAAQGILNVIAFMGIIESLYVSKCSIPAFTRNEFTSPSAGLWEPHVSLMQPIQTGMEIGTLKILPTFEEKKIYAPSSGILIQYCQRRLVATGDALFSLGYSADKIITDI